MQLKHAIYVRSGQWLNMVLYGNDGAGLKFRKHFIRRFAELQTQQRFRRVKLEQKNKGKRFITIVNHGWDKYYKYYSAITEIREHRLDKIPRIELAVVFKIIVSRTRPKHMLYRCLYTEIVNVLHELMKHYLCLKVTYLTDYIHICYI